MEISPTIQRLGEGVENKGSSRGREEKKSVYVIFRDEIVNGRCPLRGIHSSEQNPPTAAPLSQCTPPGGLQ